MKTGVILAVFYPFVSNLIGNNYMNMAYKYQKSESGTVRGIHLLFMCGNLGDDK